MVQNQVCDSRYKHLQTIYYEVTIWIIIYRAYFGLSTPRACQYLNWDTWRVFYGCFECIKIQFVMATAILTYLSAEPHSDPPDLQRLAGS